MEDAHLTTVKHLGPTSWSAECLCGWQAYFRLKKEAVAAAEHHWLESPLVTEIDKT